MKIELRHISKSLGAARVLENVSLSINPDEFFLLGPSGCGKTTLLRILAGFIAPDSGDLLFDDRCMNDVPPERRRTPMVFQGYALWPHLSVFENTAYGLRVQGLKEEEIQHRVHQTLQATRMADFQDRSPNQLSGGQQQRVAIARALAVDPGALLFDEPLSNLDAKLRMEMRGELLEIHRRKPFTAIYVTHDQEEAMTLATRIAILENGKIHQIGTPRDIYARPVNRFVAEFMGPVNWLDGKVRESGTVETRLGMWTVPHENIPGAAGREVLVGFRPAAARLSDSAPGGAADPACRLRFSGEVLQSHYTGATQRLIVKPLLVSGGDAVLQIQIVETNPRRLRQSGDRIEVVLDTDDLLILRNDSGHSREGGGNTPPPRS